MIYSLNRLSGGQVPRIVLGNSRIFCGVGDVFDDPQNLEIENLKYVAGGGFRYAIDAKEKINLRVDIGVSR